MAFKKVKNVKFKKITIDSLKEFFKHKEFELSKYNKSLASIQAFMTAMGEI